MVFVECAALAVCWGRNAARVCFVVMTRQARAAAQPLERMHHSQQRGEWGTNINFSAAVFAEEGACVNLDLCQRREISQLKNSVQE